VVRQGMQSMRTRARMLSWKISTDPAVASLSCDGARLLYTWLIPHADNLGRLAGEPDFVKASVIPLQRSTTTKQVGVWLGEMAEAGLIQWYETDGLRYISLNGWEKHQHMHANIKRISDLPPPTEHIRTSYVGPTSESVTKGEGEVEGEVERTNTLSGPADADGGRVQRSTLLANRKDWEDGFRQFWTAYPKRPNSSRLEALKVWMGFFPKDYSIADDLFTSMMGALEDSGKEWRGREPDKIPHHVVWLRRELWRNDAQ
jgi:hypothetical protein